MNDLRLEEKKFTNIDEKAMGLTQTDKEKSIFIKDDKKS